MAEYLESFKKELDEATANAASIAASAGKDDSAGSAGSSDPRLYLYLSYQTVHIPLEAAGEDDRCNGIIDYW